MLNITCSVFLFIAILTANLSAFCQEPGIVLQTGHLSAVFTLSFSPDGKTLATGSVDHTIKLWDVATGKEVKILTGHAGIITSVAFLNQDDYLISASQDGTIRIWSNKNNISRVLYVQQSDIHSVCLSSDGQTLAVGSGNGSIKIINKNTGKIINDIPAHSGSVKKVLYYDDSKYLVSAGEDKVIKIWDISSGKEIRNLEGHTNSINDLAISQDNKILASCDWDSKIILWNILHGYEIYAISDHQGPIYTLAFSPDGKYLSSGGGYGLISVRDTESGNEVNNFRLGAKRPYHIAISPDGKYIASGNSDGTINLLDVKNLRIIRSFENRLAEINTIAFHPFRNLLASAGSDNKITLWDLENLRNFIILEGHQNIINTVLFSPDGMFLASASQDNTIKLWNIETGKEIITFSGHTSPVTSLCFIPNSNILISGSADNSLREWDLTSFECIRVINAHDDWITSVSCSPDGKWIASGSGDETVKIFDVESANLVKTIQPNFGIVTSVTFLAYNNGLAVGCQDGTIQIWDTKSGKMVELIRAHDDWITSLCTSSDSKYLISTSWDSNVKLWDMTGRVKEIFTGEHANWVTSAIFSGDQRYIISAGRDGYIKFWDWKSGNELAGLIKNEQDNFIVITPANYFYPFKFYKQLSFLYNQKIYPFEQFDLQYNRPDIVLERIGYAPKELIESYRKAYYKRLKKMHFDENMFSQEFHTPEIEILNRDSFLISTDSRELRLKIKATDTEYNLDRITIWINDVPVYGMNGINLRKQEKDSVVMDIPVQLTNDENNIQVSCLNEKGVESLKESLEINYEPENPEKSKVYFVGIGVSDYQNPMLNLTYSIKDIQDIETLFKEKNPELIPLTLFNDNVTRENVLKIKPELQKTKIDDEVILAISGHGFLSDSLDFYYGTYDIDYRHPEIKGLSYDDIEWLLDSIPARKKLVLMDACHSGEVDKEILESSSAMQFAENVKAVPNTKGTDLLLDSTSIGLQNSFELMQELFTNLSKGNGAVVISAAGGMEYAYEGPDWKNGVFTYSVRKGLEGKEADLNRDNTITVNELKDYLYRHVETLTDGRQKPTSRRENLENDWRLW